MTGLVLMLSPDESGAAWMDAQSPVTVFIEKTPPHRIALKTTLLNSTAEPPSFDTWLRIDRLESYNLLDRLTDAVRTSTDNGAAEITRNVQLELVLNGGAEADTGKMVLLFKATDGRHCRLVIPLDQSGLFSDMLALAASKAAEVIDKKIAAAGAEIAKIEMHPREAELIRMQIDPLTGKEIISFRITNDFEYSFMLSAGQSQMLRKAPFLAPIDAGNGPLN